MKKDKALGLADCAGSVLLLKDALWDLAAIGMEKHKCTGHASTSLLSDKVFCRYPCQAEGFMQEALVILPTTLSFNLRGVKGSPISRILLWCGIKQSLGNLVAEMGSLHCLV